MGNMCAAAAGESPRTTGISVRREIYIPLPCRKEILMFNKNNPNGYKDMSEGVHLKTLVYGEKTHSLEFRLAQGSQLPVHSHPHEQTGYLVAGKIRLTIGAETYEVEPGDSWCIPGHVAHSATALENSVAIEVFSPVRKEYLPENLH